MKAIKINDYHAQLFSEDHSHFTDTSYLKHSFDQACNNKDTETEEFPFSATFASMKEDSNIGSSTIEREIKENHTIVQTDKNVEEIRSRIENCNYKQANESNSSMSLRKTMDWMIRSH